MYFQAAWVLKERRVSPRKALKDSKKNKKQQEREIQLTLKSGLQRKILQCHQTEEVSQVCLLFQSTLVSQNSIL